MNRIRAGLGLWAALLMMASLASAVPPFSPADSQQFVPDQVLFKLKSPPGSAAAASNRARAVMRKFNLTQVDFLPDIGVYVCATRPSLSWADLPFVTFTKEWR